MVGGDGKDIVWSYLHHFDSHRVWQTDSKLCHS